jgi:hypothetical protein
VDANVTMGNFAEFVLISAVKSNALARVLNVPWTSSCSNNGQVEERTFRIYVRDRQAVVKLVRVLNSQM